MATKMWWRKISIHLLIVFSHMISTVTSRAKQWANMRADVGLSVETQHKRVKFLLFQATHIWIPSQLKKNKDIKTTESLPELHFGNVDIYLVENPSLYNAARMKVFKSTDSCMVNNAAIWELRDEKFFIVKAKVSSN